MVLRDLDQRADVLGKTGAAKTRAGMQEFRADAVVEADAARDVLDVGAELFARSAISLMKVILVARKAFAAYLISSAVRRAVNMIGAWLRDSGR